MSTRKVSKSVLSGIQPWQIAVLVVALALCVWQFTKVAADVRKASDVKVVKSTEPVQTPPNATPNMLKVIRDKDADSDR